MEIAVGEPETVLDLDVDVALDLQKSNCSYPISHFDVVLESGHFLDLYFVITSVFECRALDLGFGD